MIHSYSRVIEIRDYSGLIEIPIFDFWWILEDFFFRIPIQLSYSINRNYSRFQVILETLETGIIFENPVALKPNNYFESTLHYDVRSKFSIAMQHWIYTQGTGVSISPPTELLPRGWAYNAWRYLGFIKCYVFP